MVLGFPDRNAEYFDNLVLGFFFTRPQSAEGSIKILKKISLKARDLNLNELTTTFLFGTNVCVEDVNKKI